MNSISDISWDTIHQEETQASNNSVPSVYLPGPFSLLLKDYDKVYIKEREDIKKHYDLLLRAKETQYEILEFKFDRVQSEYEEFKALKSAEIEALKAENMALKSAMLQLEER
jgi:hypothetical protein